MKLIDAQNEKITEIRDDIEDILKEIREPLEMGELSKNFSRDEFRCKCGCGADKVDKAFIWKLQYARDIANIPFIVRSGCRCPQHNKDEGGTENSDHLATDDWACQGADIECLSSHNRYKIVDAALQVGFRRIGIAKTFIHLGDADRNPQNVIWTYK